MNHADIFGRNSKKILTSVMNAIIPRGGPFKKGAADYDLLPRAGEIIASYEPLVRSMFPFMLAYVEYSSLLRNSRRFTRLPVPEASRFLEGMEESPFYYRRTIILLLKLVTCLSFYDIDEAAAQIGYTHGCPAKKDTCSGARPHGTAITTTRHRGRG